MHIEDLEDDAKSSGLSNSGIHITIEIIEYTAGSAVTKTVIKKNHTSVCMMSFDSLESLKSKSLPVDNFIQVVSGTVEVIINGTPAMLGVGQGIVIPAYSTYCLRPDKQFRMINTMLSGDEELL